MNKEQAKSLVRWVITAFGASLATFLATMGWVDYDTLLAMLNSEWFVSLLATGISMATGSLGWSLSAHTVTNTVASAAAVPDVLKIITAATPTGQALANSVPDSIVQAATNPNPALGVGRRIA